MFVAICLYIYTLNLLLPPSQNILLKMKKINKKRHLADIFGKPKNITNITKQQYVQVSVEVPGQYIWKVAGSSRTWSSNHKHASLAKRTAMSNSSADITSL